MPRFEVSCFPEEEDTTPLVTVVVQASDREQALKIARERIALQNPELTSSQLSQLVTLSDA